MVGFFGCCWPFTFSVCFGYGMQCMLFVRFSGAIGGTCTVFKVLARLAGIVLVGC